MLSGAAALVPAIAIPMNAVFIGVKLQAHGPIWLDDLRVVTALAVVRLA